MVSIGLIEGFLGKVAHFSKNRFRHVIKYFALDLTASDTAQMSGLSRNTITKGSGQL